MEPHPYRRLPLGAYVDQVRRGRGATYRDLSDATGIPLATIHRKIQGGNGSLTVDELDRIAHALGTTASALLTDAERGAA